MAGTKRPIRVANFSGAVGDGPLALYRAVREGPVDVVTADYLAEVNIAWLALEKQTNPEKGYEAGFLRQLDRETAEIVAAKGIKIIHNGGGLNPAGLAAQCRQLLESYGITSLKVAYVEGDNVLSLLDTLKSPGSIPHLDTKGRDLSHITKPIVSVNAYVGMSGIVEALKMGADIIISGRCCDASPVMGAAAWWHGWKETDYNQLAGSLLAGHVIECGCYATGGNFSGFMSIPQNWDQGFPVAEISASGDFDITLHEGARGLVSRDTITAQLVYEIQGPFYLNPDVVADITDVQISPNGKNRVSVTGFTGAHPPPTTKLAVCMQGGYQIEYYLFATGLDIAEKLADMQGCFNEMITNCADYTVLRLDQYGTPGQNATSQALATCMFRVFAQAPTAETLLTLPKTIGGYGLGGYCGEHACMDFRMAPRPFIAYEPFLVKYDIVNLRVIMDDAQKVIVLPSKTQPFAGQVSYDSSETHDQSKYGATFRAPLGTRVHARSGDKGSNANVGFWVLEDDEYDWLRSFLSIDRIKQLLGDDYREGYEIERFELRNLRCVHFLVKGILEGGISSTYRLDGLAKSLGEFLRAREVDLPLAFFRRGRI
ncbi:hypothetical protein COCMIDRAFT_104414 [Bipolaris oryzae ATCC 44560]|uniref:DUF1446-domain-containing protein n=1 Tax=Bipolaris oryzae ATCC 44560 TaxID=930090 RepID=W6YX63_COCMI|nr:uncharacterized protein COCMIDRAFT_104414 [Bipolaris oryzae ATCC 44560]EUC42113.1 hypothetical protein COCMIDRAFT_104414 [Bipolaris oryzae ATCC 44560]